MQVNERHLEIIGANIKSKEIFVWVCYVGQKESTSATWISKIYPTIQLSGEL